MFKILVITHALSAGGGVHSVVVDFASEAEAEKAIARIERTGTTSISHKAIRLW